MAHIVFADTVAWIALVNKSDSLHDQANAVFKDLRQKEYRFITSEFVLLEFANALSAPDFRTKASNFIAGLREMTEVEIFPAESELFNSAFELYRDRPDKEWSIVDCSSFVIMNENSISEAFTQDHHFEQAGFIVLLQSK